MGVLRVRRGADHVRRPARRALRRRDQRGGLAGWSARALLVVVLLALVVGGLGVLGVGPVGDWYDRHVAAQPDPSTPTQVAPPPGLDLPALSPAGPVATPITPGATGAPGTAGAPGTTGTSGDVDPAAVRAALAPYLKNPDLGRHVVAAVADLAADGPGGADAAPVVTIGHGAATPASTTKLLTSTAALTALGPEHTFTTEVVSGGHGRIVLVGGGDPLLASAPADPDDPTYPPRADVATLAAETAAALAQRGRTHVTLGYDDSLFTGPAFDPAWPADYGPDAVVAPITALWVDEGRPATGYGRVGDPSLYAAQTFAAALATHGITVDGAPQHGVAGSGARVLAQVHSAPLREIVEHTLQVSDNEAAEVLGHQVGVAVEGEGSFAAGVRGVLAELATLHVPTDDLDLHDGSGLSRENLVPPADLVAVLQAAFDPDHPDLGAVADGLPVAGFSGSLADRFDQAFPDARGLVRAKTGTLTNVSSLAGIAVDQQGHAMVFALMADKIPQVDETRAQNALDVAAGALAACSCGG